MGKKKNKDLNVYIVLDRSGSMGSQWGTTIEAINEYVNSLKTEKVEGKISLTAFDTTYGEGKSGVSLTEVVKNQSIAYFDPINKDSISPRGGTPLYDAAATVMHRALEADAKRTVVVIMTDGHENSSQEYSQKDVKDLTEKLTGRGWEVLFLGANFDVSSYTASAGLTKGKMRNFNPNNSFENARLYTDLASSTVAYAATGASIDIELDEEEAKRA